MAPKPFIQVTVNTNAETVWLNVDHIRVITGGNGKDTRIEIDSGAAFIVKQSPAEIAMAIQAWKS